VGTLRTGVVVRDCGFAQAQPRTYGCGWRAKEGTSPRCAWAMAIEVAGSSPRAQSPRCVPFVSRTSTSGNLNN
jgi:hypothetical protein